MRPIADKSTIGNPTCSDISVNRPLSQVQEAVMANAIQLAMLFRRDVEEQPPMWLHDKLMDVSISLVQVDRIAAALPDADRLVP